jgi:alpha-L-arabinofuranosidase
VPAYHAEAASDVPYLDVAAVKNNDGKTLTLFMVNRHPDEAISLRVELSGFAAKVIAEDVTIADGDLGATNSAKKPDRVAPEIGRGVALADGVLKGRLAPRSYHVLRVTI